MMEKYTSVSPYNYCLNNPMNMIDPTGMYPEAPLWYSHETMPRWGSFTSFMCAGYSVNESRMYSQEHFGGGGGGSGGGGSSGGYITGYNQHGDPIFNSTADIFRHLGYLGFTWETAVGSHWDGEDARNVFRVMDRFKSQLKFNDGKVSIIDNFSKNDGMCYVSDGWLDLARSLGIDVTPKNNNYSRQTIPLIGKSSIYYPKVKGLLSIGTDKNGVFHAQVFISTTKSDDNIGAIIKLFIDGAERGYEYVSSNNQPLSYTDSNMNNVGFAEIALPLTGNVRIQINVYSYSFTFWEGHQTHTFYSNTFKY